MKKKIFHDGRLYPGPQYRCWEHCYRPGALKWGHKDRDQLQQQHGKEEIHSQEALLGTTSGKLPPSSNARVERDSDYKDLLSFWLKREQVFRQHPWGNGEDADEVIRYQGWAC